MINLIIADDHSVVRQGIKFIIENTDTSIKIVAEAHDGIELLHISQKNPADVYLIDIMMPRMNGIECLRRLMRTDKNTKAIILSNYEDREFVENAFSEGARGYLLKTAGPADIIDAIEKVHQGMYYISPAISHFLIRSLKGDSTSPHMVKLTPRETEILKMIAEGSSSRQIGENLNISFHTVKTHRKNIFKKAGANSQADIIKLARMLKLVK